MRRRITTAIGCGCLLALWALAAFPAAAQQPAPGKRPSIERWEKLGVLTVIPAAPLDEETASTRAPLVEITEGLKALNWTPHYLGGTQTLQSKASKVILRRNIWCLEFAFKPLRMIEVDVPQPTGKMQRKLIWYMVYRVRHVGAGLTPSPMQDDWGHTTYGAAPGSPPQLRFFPQFVLESHEYEKAYLDRVISAAIKPIQDRETPGIKLHSSVEMSRVPIPINRDRENRGVWGVATWEDVDPRIDYFSVFVQGLTNAYQFSDPQGAFEAGDLPGTGRTFTFKTLQLNFWRPGDTRKEHEEEIRFGIPIEADPETQKAIVDRYGIDKRVDYLWVYR